MFDKKDATKVESTQHAKKKEKLRKNMPQFYFDKRGFPQNKLKLFSNKRVSMVLMYQHPMLPTGGGRNLLAKDNSLGIKSGGILK